MALLTAHAFNAHSAYGKVGQTTGSDRDVEVQVFQKSISSLRPFAGLDFKLTGPAAEALSENLRLWDMLVVDLVHPDNQLADPLVAQLLSLARFVRNHTHSLYEGTGSVDVLIEINTAILQGLLGRPENAVDSSEAA